MSSLAPADRQWFGHPRGLATLFFTEMWERFSYYGMRGLLLLFLVANIKTGGFGMTDRTGAAIYGLYVAAVYLFALPGGWIADRILGQRRAVFLGGCIIAAGHFSMAIPTVPSFYAGLCLIVVGTGLLKPNVSAMVGDLYPEGGARRDAGFSVFYSGINLGAFAGPIICGLLGEKVNWHLGFSAAGVGMVLGLIQYSLGGKYLGNAGLRQADPAGAAADGRSRRQLAVGIAVVAAAAAVLAALHLSGVLTVTLVSFATGAKYFMVGLAILYFAWVLLFGKLDSAQRKRIVAIFVFFVAAVLFWAGYEQGGSSLNLFAERLTNRLILGWEMPASVLQSVNPIFVILFAPAFGALWLRLGARQPSTPAKMGFGLAFLAFGFFLLAWGATYTVGGARVTPMWLVGTYFLHTIGELCLSPVGLSSVTKLSPRHLVGQMMGTWFMGTALGNLLAGLAAGGFSERPVSEQFSSVGWVMMGSGAVLLLLSPLIVRFLIGVENPVALDSEAGEPKGRVTVLSKKWLLPDDKAEK
ncbi:MAG TPA: peptide MFS transporter [Thermoanaerobaculia bacterium]|nr:peptide MFS transporter [Thermoanaerobaculia bacterium]